MEAVFDIARHLSVKCGWGRPETYPGTIKLLELHGVLTHTPAQNIKSMADYRNRLVHDYSGVTADEIHLLLQTRLDDFDTFTAAITAFLDGRSTDK
jgi:uncharacterized protein YutE (UPF0331/DUF86 family)